MFRYNTTSKSWVLIHGLQADNVRGGRKWEVYGNIFSEAGGGSRVAFQAKAGTGVAFNNDITAPNDPWLGGVDWYHERDVYKAQWNDAGICDGTSAWDTTYGGVTLCRDQIGAGSDSGGWADAPENNLPSPAQKRAPAYVWGILNGDTFTPSTKVNNSAANVIKNRDYYEQENDFNGTVGVGCGPLADRPVTCTTGVAYWATNQSCSDLSGMVGAIPSSPIDGTLYKCTGTNTWTAYFTPYTYPHPLNFAPPTNLRSIENQ